MKTGLMRRLDTLEEIHFPGPAPIPTGTDVPPPIAFALRLLDESDDDVRARAARHRTLMDDTQLIVIDLYEQVQADENT